MKSNLERFKHSSSSTQAYRSYGSDLDAYLYANAAPGNTFEALLLLRLLPLGERGLAAMFHSDAKPSSASWLELQFGDPSSKRLIWNACAGLTPDQWKSLFRIFNDDHVAKIHLDEILPFRRQSERGASREFARIMEADCACEFPQALVSYANFSARYAAPDSIDLEGASPWISRETVKRGNLAEYFPGFFKVINILKNSSKQDSCGDLLASFVQADLTPLNELDAKAIFYLEHCLRLKFLAGRKKPSVPSRIRYLSEIPYLLMSSKREETPTMNGNRSRALHYLRQVDPSFGDQLELRFKAALYKNNHLRVHLFSLDATYREFGLARCYPDLQDGSQYEAVCRRLILILLSTGRRLSCLTDITPANFHSWNGMLSVQVGRTKVKTEDNGSVPLSALLSDNDLAFIQQYLLMAKESGLQERNILLETGIQRFLSDGRANADDIDNAFAKVLSADLGVNRRLRLHDLRRMALTWMVIRFTLALNPELRDCGVLKHHCLNGVFSDEAIARLKSQLIPHSGVDIIGTIASLAGHSSRQTFRRTYNYSMPVLSALHALKRWLAMEPFVTSNSVVSRVRTLIMHSKTASDL